MPGDPYFEDLEQHVANNDFFLAAAQKIPAGAVTFDIGANIGLTAVLAAQRAQKVYAFEPGPATFKNLKRTIEANKLDGIVEAVNVALGAAEGQLSFFNDATSGSASHLITDATLARESATTVPVTTVDAFCTQHGIDRLDFMKIDIEGFEIDALAGARQTIERFRPAALIEFNAFTMIGFRNINPRELLSLVRSVFPFVYRWKEAPLQIKDDADALGFVHDNLVSAGCVDDLYASFEALT